MPPTATPPAEVGSNYQTLMSSKELYETPSTTALVVKIEGVICSSAVFITPFYEEEIW